MSDKQYFIYVIGRHKGPVKVGITCSLGARLATLQTGCPFRLELIHYRECRDQDHAREHEGCFHRGYQDLRLVGEWFKVDGDSATEGVDSSFDYEEFWEEGESQRIFSEAWEAAHGSH